MGELAKIHGLRQVWCTPDQDRRVPVKPIRLTPSQGAYRQVRVLWDTLSLPDTTGYYHVYQIGQVPPAYYNLPELGNQWTPASSIVEMKNMVIRAHVGDGPLYPLRHLYFRITADRNLIVAAKILNGHPADINTQDLYIQLYSNAFFNSTRWANLKQSLNKLNALGVQYLYRDIVTAADVAAIRNATDAAIARSTTTRANTIYIVNGRYTSSIWQAGELKAGDAVEVFVDSSVRKIRRVKVSDLRPFTSIRDNTIKRLFPAEKETSTISFKDDIDFFVCKLISGDVVRNGIFFDQYSRTAIRQITHNAYAFNDVQLQAILTANPILGAETDCYMQAVIRHAGYERSLVLENNRLNELYKLDVDDINDALVGLDATIDEWKAENLEDSDYLKLMSNFEEDITEAMAENAYGYYLLTKLFADSYPTIMNAGGNRSISKPAGLRRAVISEYDSDGLLIRYSNSGENSEVYPLAAPSNTTAIVELLSGNIKPVNQVARWMGVPVVTTNVSLHRTGFRCYACPIVGGIPNNEWVDVTEEAYYTVSANGLTLTWDVEELNSLQLFPAVVQGDDVQFYQVPLSTPYPGFIRFSVTADVLRSPVYPASLTATPVLQNEVLTIPPGVLDIIMDGESLIEDIDFKVIWPQVVVYKKPKRKPEEGLSVLVRTHGFCSPTMERYKPREVGFINNGLLSVNDAFNLRDDRNSRIVVGGGVKLRSAVKFSEDGHAYLSGASNGKPYSVSDILMPVENFTSLKTVDAYEASREIDGRVSPYINLKKPMPTPPTMNPITARYELYSPFCSALLHLLADGWLTNGELDDYDNTDIAGWVAQWLYLLDYDPAVLSNVDQEYVMVLGHQYSTTMEITSKQYAFLEKVIRDYLTIPGNPSRVDLTPLVTIAD